MRGATGGGPYGELRSLFAREGRGRGVILVVVVGRAGDPFLLHPSLVMVMVMATLSRRVSLHRVSLMEIIIIIYIYILLSI